MKSFGLIQKFCEFSEAKMFYLSLQESDAPDGAAERRPPLY